MILKDNINLCLSNIYNNKEFDFIYYYFNNKKFNNTDNLKEYNILNTYTDVNLSHNFIIKAIIQNFLNKRLKLKIKYYDDKLRKSILTANRTSLTLKNSKDHKFKLITCLGSGNSWIGIGRSEGKYFKKSYAKSINISKKYIYNLNFKCNDYEYLKFKGCKFRAINMPENKKNLKIYENITKVSGDKKIKLISYSSKTPINIIKSILNCF